MERQERILKYGSPLFSYKNPSLSAGSSFILDYETMIPTSQKYLPFNFLSITNNSEGDIEIWFDDDSSNKKLIPKSTILVFENIWFRKIRVVNIDSVSISANRIEFVAQRLPIKDEIARMPDIPVIHKLKVLLGL